MTLHERWGIAPSREAGVSRLANRILILFRSRLVMSWCLYPEIRRTYFFNMAYKAAGNKELNDSHYYHRTVRNRYGDSLHSNIESAFENSQLVSDLSSVSTPFNLANILESLIGSFKDNKSKYYNELISVIQDALVKSETKVFEIENTSHDIVFRPLGSTILDENIVSRTMTWMSAYPSSRQMAESAFKHYSSNETERLRNMLDDLRLSLESLLKEKFGERNLANQKPHIGKYLSEQGYDSSGVAAFDSIFKWFDSFQNENVKHTNRTLNENEAEFIMYMTFSLMYSLLK